MRRIFGLQSAVLSRPKVFLTVQILKKLFQEWELVFKIWTVEYRDKWLRWNDRGLSCRETAEKAGSSKWNTPWKFNYLSRQATAMSLWPNPFIISPPPNAKIHNDTLITRTISASSSPRNQLPPALSVFPLKMDLRARPTATATAAATSSASSDDDNSPETPKGHPPPPPSVLSKS